MSIIDFVTLRNNRLNDSYHRYMMVLDGDYTVESNPVKEDGEPAARVLKLIETTIWPQIRCYTDGTGFLYKENDPRVMNQAYFRDNMTDIREELADAYNIMDLFITRSHAMPIKKLGLPYNTVMQVEHYSGQILDKLRELDALVCKLRELLPPHMTEDHAGVVRK